MNSTCHGSSGKQNSAKHRRKADPSRTRTGDFVLPDQVFLLETIFTMVARGITRACIREGAMMRLQSFEMMRKRQILLKISLDRLIHGMMGLRLEEITRRRMFCSLLTSLPNTPWWDVIEEGEMLPFRLGRPLPDPRVQRDPEQTAEGATEELHFFLWTKRQQERHRSTHPPSPFSRPPRTAHPCNPVPGAAGPG